MGAGPEPKNERNWAVWREYRLGGIGLADLGAKYDITASRTRQIVVRCDRQVLYALRKLIRPTTEPLEDHIRNGILGVEFTFVDDLAITWEQLWSGEWTRLDNETWFKLEMGDTR